MTNQQLQTVLDALQEHARYAGSKTVEAIAIVKHMMQAEPVAGILYENRKVSIGAPDSRDEEYGWKPLYAAPQAAPVQAEPVAWLSIDSIGERYLCFSKPRDNDQVQALYTVPQGVPEWLPISSAPKDGTMFDGWNGERVVDVTWEHPSYSPRGHHAWCVSGYTNGHDWAYDEVKGLTHWLPIPSSPKDTP